MINQLELSEQFEKIFTSDEVDEFYLKWKEGKNKAPTTIRDKAVKILYFSIIIMTIIFLGFYFYHEGNQVEQKVAKVNGSLTFYTIVWVNGEIAKSWYTDPDKVTDSLKTAQYNEGEKLLKTLK
jgi:hypothetical protein